MVAGLKRLGSPARLPELCAGAGVSWPRLSRATQVSGLALFTLAVCSLWSSPAALAAADPARIDGVWLAPAEDADDVDALMELHQVAGSWHGRIRAILVTRSNQAVHDDSKCEHCPLPQQGQAFKGLEVMWGVHEHQEDKPAGQVLDPGTGQVYDCDLEASADGQTLKVRAYKGVRWAGHTMVWRRP